jgi:hypothetical protein
LYVTWLLGSLLISVLPNFYTPSIFSELNDNLLTGSIPPDLVKLTELFDL